MTRKSTSWLVTWQQIENTVQSRLGEMKITIHLFLIAIYDIHLLWSVVGRENVALHLKDPNVTLEKDDMVKAFKVTNWS